jgi:hypothetical protein
MAENARASTATQEPRYSRGYRFESWPRQINLIKLKKPPTGIPDSKKVLLSMRKKGCLS